MARTEDGRRLTEQHRLGQLRVRGQAVRDFARLWPTWEGDEDSFSEMVLAAVVLVRAYHGLSSTLAASYFTSFRSAEQVRGEASPQLAEAIDPQRVAAALMVTGRDSVRDALRAGRSAEDARRAALTRSSGAITREVLAGGRETLLRSVAADREALGWARVTDGDPCAFCAMLAGRGPVYEEDTVGFQAHGHCGCSVMPFYQGAQWPGKAREFKAMYDAAYREAKESGELDRGTSNDLLNAFRRYLERERSQQ